MRRDMQESMKQVALVMARMHDAAMKYGQGQVRKVVGPPEKEQVRELIDQLIDSSPLEISPQDRDECLAICRKAFNDMEAIGL